MKVINKKILNFLFKYFEIIKMLIYVCFFCLFLYLIYFLLVKIPKFFLFILIGFYLIKLFNNFIKQNILTDAKKKKTNKQAIIIGTGISGIAAAYYLQKRNIPYIILEKASELGGTWRDHKFHGCRVDTEIAEYCYSFDIILGEKTTNWLRSDVMNYLSNITKKFNILPNIKFNKKVDKANFDSFKKKWIISTNDGDSYCADFLLNCNGFSNTTPYIPKFKGKNDFQGNIIHSINLNESQTFYDKKVVIVGSGATMTSIVPSLVKICKSLTIIQRSPSYIYETDCKPDLLCKIVKKLDLLGIKKIKNVYQIYRMLDDEIIFGLLRKFQFLGKKFFRMQWEDVAEKEFIDTHLTPLYNLLEQRIPVSSGLKELIKTKSIEFETGEISHFTKNGILMKSQKHIPCDVCILATGFDLNFFNFPIEIDGILIDTRQINWYKGLMLGGIPNYFQAIGCFDCSWTQRVESAGTSPVS